MAARSSRDLACWRRAISRARCKLLLCFPLLISRLLQQQLALEPIHLGLIDAFFRGLHRLQRLAQRAQPLLDLVLPAHRPRRADQGTTATVIALWPGRSSAPRACGPVLARLSLCRQRCSPAGPCPTLGNPQTHVGCTAPVAPRPAPGPQPPSRRRLAQDRREDQGLIQDKGVVEPLGIRESFLAPLQRLVRIPQQPEGHGAKEAAGDARVLAVAERRGARICCGSYRASTCLTWVRASCDSPRQNKLFPSARWASRDSRGSCSCWARPSEVLPRPHAPAATAPAPDGT